jgi:FO synthase
MPAVAQTELETLLENIALGEQISHDSACRLIRCPAELLPNLLQAAGAERARYKLPVITYSRKVFLPLTNLCADYCGYCAFRRDPGDAGAHTMTPDEILASVAQAEKLGCTEALFSLGDKPETLFPEMRETLRRLGYKSTLHYLEAMCVLVLEHSKLLPHANPGLMSASWISRLSAVSPSLGLMLETSSSALLRPGGAHEHAPDKIPARRVHVLEEAGKQQVPFTTGLLIGIGETLDDRVHALFAIQELHERYGHIQEVIVQKFRTKLSIPMREWPELSEDDLLRTIAVARLILGGRMNVQAPPNLSAPNFSRLLDAGINDWGGVSPLTPDFINPERPWPHLHKLQEETEAAGFELKQRLPVYPEFIPSAAARGGLLAQRLRQACDSSGLVRSAA